MTLFADWSDENTGYKIQALKTNLVKLFGFKHTSRPFKNQLSIKFSKFFKQ